ncbi:MAG: DUF1573 domain-containing protein [Saprospiraceae bacterium]|nr:DUF1573 domain-containing protein [Saprospiraceae bacterium]
MRFLLIITFLTVAFLGCEQTSEVTKNKEDLTNTETIVAAKEVASADDKETPEIVEEAVVDNEPKVPAKRAKIQFAQKSFDYGMIEQGDKVEHRFTFTNTGDADLIIKDAQASCGCTTPSYPFVPIKPGKSAHIGVTFSSVGKMGTQHPTITVTSNTYPKVTTLRLEGFVTDKLARNENIEPNLNINPEENVTKGGDIIKEEAIMEDDNN